MKLAPERFAPVNPAADVAGAYAIKLRVQERGAGEFA